MDIGKVALWAFGILLDITILAVAFWLYVDYVSPGTTAAWDQIYIHFMDDTFGGESFLEDEQ